MSEAESVPAPFKKQTVSRRAVSEGKAIDMLARTDILTAGVQIVSGNGGETNLHSHAGTDQLYLVLDGEATFTTEGDLHVATLRPDDTFLIPRGTPYSFASTGKVDLVIVRFGAKAQGVVDKRTDLTPRLRKGQVVA